MKNASAKEEKRDAIKQAGMLLSDDELDQVAGGIGGFGPPPQCGYNPYCDYFGTPNCHKEFCPYAQGRI